MPQSFLQAVAGINGPYRVAKIGCPAWPGTCHLLKAGQRFPLASGQIDFIMKVFARETARHA